MNKQGNGKIEYLDWTWSPFVGCTFGCSYCWARKAAKRQKCAKCKAFMPHLHLDRLNQPAEVKKPQRIGVCFSSDLWGDVVEWGCQALIFDRITTLQRHQFLLLTKQPQNIEPQYASPNLWQGVSVTCADDLWRIEELVKRVPARRVVSFEPLLGEIVSKETDLYLWLRGIDWVIIGGLTPKAVHKPSWVSEIINHAWMTKISVFVKDNAQYDYLGGKAIQEYPKGW